MSNRPAKVVMLGWEFPPFITGGLGTACYGLTKAMDEMGVEVTFVLPKAVRGEHASHVDLMAPGLDPEHAEFAKADPSLAAVEEARVAAVAAALRRGTRDEETREPSAPGALPAGVVAATDAEIAAQAGLSVDAAGVVIGPAAGHGSAVAAGVTSAGIGAGNPPGARAGLPAGVPAGSHPSAIALGRHIRMLAAPLIARGAYTPAAAQSMLERIAQSSAAAPRVLRPGALSTAARGLAGRLPGGFAPDLLDGLDEAAQHEALALLEAWEEYGSDDPAAAAEMVEMIRAVRAAVPEAGGRGAGQSLGRGGTAPDYAGDLLAQSEAYARFVVSSCRNLDFDVIHAHDWLTYPAGIALARVTGKPLVVHVHSTEFDRSGVHVNQPVYNIERRGMHAAVRVITVSMLTRNICANRYAVNPAKCDVVYNGVELDPKALGASRIEQKDRVVLYFGRITMQKGPEYFVHAAKRVLDVIDNVKFVVAGSGDQAQNMIELAASLGIGHKMLFTGFLRGKDIQRVFNIADLYVMPSVSEPFGIAPLEALGNRVPVLISRQSGVSEILQNALKCDFWDVEEMANKIVAVLKYPPLRRTLRDEGFDEVRGISWAGAAKKTLATYGRAIEAVRRH